MENLRHDEDAGQWLLPDRLTADVFNQLPWFVMVFNRQTKDLIFENTAYQDWLKKEKIQPVADLPALLFDLYLNQPGKQELIHEIKLANSRKYIFKSTFKSLGELSNLVVVSSEEVSQVITDQVVFRKDAEGFYVAHKKEPRLKDRETSQRIQELNRSNSQLEDFAYVASHDLQEPLRKILAFGERLQKKFNEDLPDEGKSYLERMMSATLRMRGLIDNLLTLSRVSRKPEEHITIDLNELMQEVLSDFDMRIDEMNGKVDCSDLPSVTGSRTQLYQLFQNLVSNSLKFSRIDTPPHISITTHEVAGKEIENPADPEAPYICIDVSDNGIGFDQKHANNIFNVFHRLHGRSEYEGTGIGLAICKKVVDNHRGSITARSIEGSGTTISVFLPR